MSLSNHDLLPVPQSDRNWGLLHFLSLWVGMAVCIPTYMIASSLIDGGMNWKQALFTVFLGNVLVLIPIILNGHVGAKYGIPFPIFARASFGVLGANIPAMLRAVVACGWFGIQTWIGGNAIYVLLKTVFPSLEIAPNFFPEGGGPFGLFDITSIQYLCFLAFWGINMGIIYKGMGVIKWVETACAPFLIVAGLALLSWAIVKADGLGPLLNQPDKFATTSDFFAFFVPALTGMVSFWATLSINIPDFTRYATGQKSQIWGQALGLPTTMVLFAFIGIVVTSATPTIFGEVIWDPIVLMSKFGNPFLIALSLFALSIATLSTNIAANVVGPANDFANLAPKYIDFRTGSFITGFIGLFMFPWKLVQDPSGYIFTWLIGYSALLGPIAGILMCDYYLVNDKTLDVDALYRRGGRYEFRGGFNPAALIALVIGILPNLPGFLLQIGAVSKDTFAPFWQTLYTYAWFNGLAVAGLVYFAVSKLFGPLNRSAS